ncbi:hypothetical protein UFOVP1654_15 [uncultured Caudovirales phage]|uniref:Uncharacterized protein n=1 Tax=uncultured Caudovirales phage TaxID=2100421 RepID=A0A6J5Q5W5_9CAUD|nr:hypothetical protein UFOVP878_22 [uncultured Caudovirales phage]CAB4180040.1 hypothetical protein UFOVP1044_2 [uncultured Caudovirales phage]CAB4222151.1 hypothetical protein UFOVP1654_15 [uncultured Caudovirales phage]
MENLMAFDISNYTTVAEKVAEFYTKYPEGSIQFEFMGVMPGDPEKIWGIARAYRTPDDLLPGIGTASEFIKGKSPYTAGSEIQNLETSCWGRACSSLNVGNSKGLSSKEEIIGSRERQAPGPAKPKETVAVVTEPPRDSDIPVDEEEPQREHILDPWDLNYVPEIPECLHGPMSRRSGISKKTGKPYAGYFCDNEPQCDPKFDRS